MRCENCDDFKGFSDNVYSVISDNANYEIDLQFYLTQRCNLSCRGCYMAASPNVSGDVLPIDDISFYLNEFGKNQQFTGDVVLSGGEIFTLPIDYVESASRQILNRGYGLQLKTNGLWVDDLKKRDGVVAMLRRLKPGRGLTASKEQFHDFLASKPKWFLRMLGRNIVSMWMYKSLPTKSLLSMAVSVDDMLHPAKSADWFVKIVNLITNDKHLRNKVELKSFTLLDSVPMFESCVLNNPNLKVQNFSELSKGYGAKYMVNGVQIESYIGDFVDVKNVSDNEKLSNFVLPSLGNGMGRLVYCFFPDKTVGLDSWFLESVGRVSYVKADGSQKTFDEIRHDICSKLILDYKKAIAK